MEPRISVITLGVEDLERSRRFYADGLGFPMRPESAAGEVCFLDLGRMWLALFGRSALADDATVPDDGAGFARFSIGHNVRTREEVDQTMALVAGIGGRVVKPAQDTFWGGYAGYFADPDGFLWEVAWAPMLPDLVP